MTVEPVTLRCAEKADHAVLAGLMLASNRHYWGASPTAEQMTSDAAAAILEGRSGVCAYLIEAGPTPLGFATVAILHPAPTAAGTFFLKDLYISDAARGRGYGHAVMARLAEVAERAGCERFDWTAETDNPGALAFYDRLGAERVSEKVYYRLSGDALKQVSADAKTEG